MSHFITGVVCEILTPFNKDKSINYEQLEEMIAWHMSKGIKAFFVNGLAAECHALTTEEKIEILKRVYSVTQGKAKIMACSFESTVELNKELLDLYEETVWQTAIALLHLLLRHKESTLRLFFN